MNNESSEIIRMFNTCFDKFLPNDKKAINYYPENIRAEIDELNEWVYDTVNNGVYKSGFATSQQACKYCFSFLFGERYCNTPLNILKSNI